MSWLLRDGDVLAALEDRRPGWPASLRGAIVMRAPALVQTVTSPAPLDLAWCGEMAVEVEGGDRCLEVRRLARLAPRRVAIPRLARGAVVAAGEGAFERWHLQVGDRLEIREV
jgi:hypothetical protein